jgi:hypothetical protein
VNPDVLNHGSEELVHGDGGGAFALGDERVFELAKQGERTRRAGAKIETGNGLWNFAKSGAEE